MLGVELLSLVVSLTPAEKLNRQIVRVLTSFFCGKLDDMATIKPALNGLATLTLLQSFSPVEAVVTIEAIFRHIKMKSIVQDQRFKVFSIIDSVMAFHRDVLKNMGKQFLDGYINLAEGEKDPRNLIVAFAIARVILIEFDISGHVESMFNILFCYFPITFRPPPNDRYGISTDDLRMALRNCLNATPAFGPLAIPVFLEKVSAGSRVTKKDTLQTMAVCLPVYGSALARVSARKLWNALKLEIFQPVDPETEQEALKTTQILVKTIYMDEEEALEHDEDIQGLARDACEECVHILKEPEKTQAKPAIKILCTFMTTTPSVARYTISQAVPHLVRLFLTPDEASTREPTLLLLSDLIAAARDSTKKSSLEDADPPLLPYKDEVLGVFIVGLKLITTRNAALSGLKVMATTKRLLSDEELGFIVHNVNEIIQADGEELYESIEAILEVLTIISDIAPRHVVEQTLPLLSSSLPDTAPARDDATGREKCWQTLTTLSKLCIQTELFEQLVIRLTTKLDLLCFPSSEQMLSVSADPEPTAAYAHMILKALAQALSTKVKGKHPDIAKYLDRLVPIIFNVFVSSAFLSEEQMIVAKEPRLVQVAAEIINFVVQSVPSEKQRFYSVELSKAIIDGNVSTIAEGFQKAAKSERFSIFDASTTSAKRNILALLSAAVISLHKEARLSLRDVSGFLEMLLRWVLDIADNDIQKLAALHIVSSILNRQVEDLSVFLNTKLDVYWNTEIVNDASPLPRRRWAIKTWIWITKALLVRKHPLAMKLTEQLYDAFDDEAIGWDAAKAIGQIPSPDTVLTKANHAEVKLIPLLLRGLDLPDAEIRSNIIDTFLAAAEGETPEKSLVAEHGVTLVNAMLKNCVSNDVSSTQVRISALRYLAVLPSIVRYDILHPHKATVLRELAKVLDDPKRAVRKQAVDARTNWFKYKG
ncbi:MMS19 nucleotide excision repair protein-like protein [Psilocybe cubensis]|uniref:MMS19 nucleotide excision repair protein n=2 Tax=Psilocybe cubensis TaxID=181762 RepID=A0A8H8CHI3_PSICU|nr:MMS19 nucleotide excision repair protein-like protein [Psilocybe cubensis]KAH9479537.1 MMS19 nucleotide excision repair protein-like protein [Psilocybe cubensis]